MNLLSHVRWLLLAFGYSGILLSHLAHPGTAEQGAADTSYRENRTAGAPVRGSLKLENVNAEVRAPFSPDAGETACAWLYSACESALTTTVASQILAARPWRAPLGRAPPFLIS